MSWCISSQRQERRPTTPRLDDYARRLRERAKRIDGKRWLASHSLRNMTEPHEPDELFDDLPDASFELWVTLDYPDASIQLEWIRTDSRIPEAKMRVRLTSGDELAWTWETAGHLAWKCRANTQAVRGGEKNKMMMLASISTLSSWTELRTKLTAMPMIDRIELLAMGPKQVDMILHYRGTPDSLARAIEGEKIRLVQNKDYWVISRD